MTVRLAQFILRCSLFGLLVMLPNVGFSGQSTWDVNALLRELSQIKLAVLGFIEKKQSIFLTDELQTTGNLLYRAPDYMEKKTLDPFLETVTIDGDVITIEKTKVSGKKEGTKEVQKYTIESNFLLHTAVGSIRAMLAGNLQLLEDNYRVDMEGDKVSWMLTLTPKAQEIKNQVERILLAGSGVEIRRIETINSDGDETSLALTYQQLQ